MAFVGLEAVPSGGNDTLDSQVVAREDTTFLLALGLIDTISACCGNNLCPNNFRLANVREGLMQLGRIGKFAANVAVHPPSASVLKFPAQGPTEPVH